MTKKKAPAGQGEGIHSNQKEEVQIMTSVLNPNETTIPCSRYEWCRGHGGFTDEGEDSTSTHLGPDAEIPLPGGHALFCLQISSREGNGLGLEGNIDELITHDNVDDLERQLLALIAGMRSMLATLPETVK